MPSAPRTRSAGRLYELFIVLLLTTEFYYINIGSGIAHIYHFAAPLIVVLLLRYVPRALKSRILWFLIGFFGINLIAALLADSAISALASLASLGANIGIALAVALILLSGRIRLRRMVDIVLAVALLSVALGVAQLVLFKLAGINIGLSESQRAQIVAGFAPGLRTEANTFAKFLNTAFLLIFPMSLSFRKSHKTASVVLFLFLGMLLSLTRSALYALAVTLALFYLWHIFSNKRPTPTLRPLLLVLLGSLLLVGFSQNVSEFNTYGAHKLSTFFNEHEILHGDSASLRLESQDQLWHAFFRSNKTLLFGNGWGQVFFQYGSLEMQAGGAEFATALAYGGIVSGLFYFAYILCAILSAHKMIRRDRDSTVVDSYTGVLLALVGLFIIGQFNSALIAPEYWMVIGMAIYLDCVASRTSSSSRRLAPTRTYPKAHQAP